MHEDRQTLGFMRAARLAAARARTGAYESRPLLFARDERAKPFLGPHLVFSRLQASLSPRFQAIGQRAGHIRGSGNFCRVYKPDLRISP